VVFSAFFLLSLRRPPSLPLPDRSGEGREKPAEGRKGRRGARERRRCCGAAPASSSLSIIGGLSLTPLGERKEKGRKKKKLREEKGGEREKAISLASSHLSSHVVKVRRPPRNRGIGGESKGRRKKDPPGEKGEKREEREGRITLRRDAFPAWVINPHTLNLIAFALAAVRVYIGGIAQVRGRKKNGRKKKKKRRKKTGGSGARRVRISGRPVLPLCSRTSSGKRRGESLCQEKKKKKREREKGSSGARPVCGHLLSTAQLLFHPFTEEKSGAEGE